MHLGDNVNEYKKVSLRTIENKMARGGLCCDRCMKPYVLNTSYERGIKESGETLTVQVVRCNTCNNYQALLPDFICPHKQYSATEIEKVLSERSRVSAIDTDASESTVRRWKGQVGERTRRAIGIIKHILAAQAAHAVSEIWVPSGTVHEELSGLLQRFPNRPTNSGSAIGEANIWIGSWNKGAYI